MSISMFMSQVGTAQSINGWMPYYLETNQRSILKSIIGSTFGMLKAHTGLCQHMMSSGTSYCVEEEHGHKERTERREQWAQEHERTTVEEHPKPTGTRTEAPTEAFRATTHQNGRESETLKE